MTVTQRIFNFDILEESSICALDIAWALSGTHRFTGHTRPWYSVAQHSVRVSYMVPQAKALSAFGHDMAEAYIGDINTPLKNKLDDMSDGAFRRFELQIEELVWKAMGIPSSKGDQQIKDADYHDYEVTRDALILDGPMRLSIQSPEQAFLGFVARWIELDPSKKQQLHDHTRLLQSR